MIESQANVLAKRTLLLAAGAMGFAQTVLFAILAPLGREVGLVEVQIGAIISSSSLTLFLVSPLWGRASDLWGRRKILLIGLFGYSVGTVMFASVFQAALLGYLIPVTALILLIVTRVANAVVMAAVAPSANAYMADITTITDRIKGMGAIGAAGNIGSILGPAIGGLLASISLLTPLYFSVFLTLAAAILTLYALPELPKAVVVTKPKRLKYSDPRIFPLVIAGVFLFMGFAIVQQTIAFRFQDVLGLDGTETAKVVGISLMFSAAAALLVQLLVIPRLHVRPFVLLRISMPIMMIAFAMMALSESQNMYILAMCILGLGMGLAGPGFMAGASVAVSSEEQGAVAGVAGSCGPLGFTVGPLLGTYLYSIDGSLPYWFAFGSYFLLFFFTLKFSDKKK
ncbi:MFS transporter [Paraglaciecola psychrophila]|jgi:MFS family permease|uniref:Major facilitator superfamily transporter n=1 Tax=Paraglaciecola psychrophila 170 TaxID=1129794 RepID=K7A8V2_9ALTE|nr:MFS transporter [Paraglaciecola psychrophila]AGH45104.1 major facilitator superfamily transporter [Paraglaciecola psychrophila 170]GAC38752.1 multidrug resistance protein 2 [Paraglaciecola psychrophila 170]